MVAITASVNGNEDEAHVFCGACFWGDDVPAKEAVDIAIAHEASQAHIQAELDDVLFELMAESVRDNRGH